MKRIVTEEDYVQSLKDLHSIVYYNGRRMNDVTEHQAFKPHINSAALTSRSSRWLLVSIFD
jgi:aromatic ring hydroxylase